MITLLATIVLAQKPLWTTFQGKGKRIVLLAGDEEYRSEECLTQLAKILSQRHGFHCDVIYPIASDGTISPTTVDNLPGIELLARADLMICMLRFRNLPDEQMKYFDAYVKSKKPIIGFRTATHAFNIPAGRAYAKYGFQSKEWAGGFGRQILGETWIAHHGQHLVQSTRTEVASGMESHPLLRGVGSIWVPSDVYAATPLAPSTSLLLGIVLKGMKPTDLAEEGKQNNPKMPVVWLRDRVITSTLGSGLDFQDENLRRLTVNACHWLLNQPVQPKTNVDLVGKYDPSPIGFGKFKPGIRPND